MRIEIEVIPHGHQRYDTVGDYWTDQYGNRHFRVSEMPDERYVELVAVHELIEQILCRHRGISEKEIDEFDMGFRGEGEPGMDLKAPYRKEHLFATMVEQMLAAELNVNWEEYDAVVEGLSNGK